MFLRLRLLLTFALCPVIVTALPSNAAAAVVAPTSTVAAASTTGQERWGPADSFTFTPDLLDGPTTGATVKCSGKAAHVLQSPILSTSVTLICKIDRHYAGDPVPGDLDLVDTSVQLQGAQADGNYCETGDYHDFEKDPLAGLSWRIPQPSVACVAEVACFAGTWHDEMPMTGDVTYRWEYCEDIELGPPPKDVPSCPNGMPLSVMQYVEKGTTVYAAQWTRNIKIPFSLNKDMQLYKEWRMEARIGVNGGPVPDVRAQGVWRDGWLNIPDAAAGNNHWTWEGSTVRPEPETPGPKAMLYNSVEPAAIGVWIWATGTGGAGQAPNTTKAHNQYTYGQNDPAQCHFYFGPKFYDDPNSTLDEPMGGLGETVVGSDVPPDMNPTLPPEDPGTSDCSFVITDPTTWLEGGMCAVVGVLGLVLNTLRDVLAKLGGIVTAILNGLKGLLVPSDGFLDGKMRDLKLAWKETTVGQYADALSGLSPGSASGCGGLPLDVSLPGDVEIHESLGAACSGPMANVAGLVRLGLSAALTVGGALACVRIVGAGFGWAPAIGRGPDA